MRGSAIFRTGVAPGGALAGPWVQNSLWTAARAVPSLDLRFADNKSLVDAVTGASLVTFTRASSATFVDSSGVLRSAVTNLLLRSEEFDNASWQLFGTTSRTANTTVAPNGTITADSVTLPASSGIFQIVNGLANTAYTFSIWIRCDTTQSVRLVINTNLSDPATLTVTATSTWQRFNITKTTSVGTTTVTSQVDTGGGNTFFLWGAQLEQSATVGEYIPTTSAINSAPRFDHNPTTGESLGLLVEEARTNLLLRSEEFDNASWNSATGARTVTANSIAAPDGLTTADTVTADGTTAVHFVSQSLTLTAVPYVYSVFAKAGTNNFLQLRLFTGFGGMWANFNLATGVVGTVGVLLGATPTSSIQAYPNGWYRCTMVFTPTAATSSVAAYIVDSATAGGGQPNSLSTSVYLWGAQLE